MGISSNNKRKMRHCKSAYRSGLEERIAAHLRVAFNNREPIYERFYIPYVVPSRSAKYTPDFILPNGIIIETKGRFLTEDRQKHLLIKQQYPELDIRFVFTNSHTKLYKGSPTSYGDWCNKHGFMYADRNIPTDWLYESLTIKDWEATHRIIKPHKRKAGEKPDEIE